jgi:uncharacterized protein YoxC
LSLSQGRNLKVNNEQRKTLAAIAKDLEELADKAEELIEKVAEVISDEEEKLENMPDGLRDSDRGEAIQDVIDNLESAKSDAESGVESLRALAGTCEEQ